MSIEKTTEHSKEAIKQKAEYDFLRAQVVRLEKGQTLERPGENQRGSAHWKDDLWQGVSETWQCVAETFQAVSDAFLSKRGKIIEQEKIIKKVNNGVSITELTKSDIDEIKRKFINNAQEFIEEYKEMSNVYYKLYHEMNIYHAGQRILKEDQATNEQLHHIQRQIDQSLDKINELLKNEHFPKKDFNKFVDSKMRILREKAEFVGAAGKCISADYKVLGDYVITYAKEAEVFARVLSSENNQSLQQLQEHLEASSKQICQCLMNTVRNEYNEAQKYCQRQREENIKDAEDRALFTRFKHHYLEPFHDFLQAIEQSMEEHPDAGNGWRKYQALKPASDALSSQFVALKQRLEAWSQLEAHIAAVEEKRNKTYLYSQKLLEEYGKHEAPKYLNHRIRKH